MGGRGKGLWKRDELEVCGKEVCVCERRQVKLCTISPQLLARILSPAQNTRRYSKPKGFHPLLQNMGI